jgi:hypothetical protein
MTNVRLTLFGYLAAMSSHLKKTGFTKPAACFTKPAACFIDSTVIKKKKM